MNHSSGRNKRGESHQLIQRIQLKNDRVRHHILNSGVIEDKNALDFWGAFTAVAVKEGQSQSERVHTDPQDQGITWVLPIGDWEGGSLIFPQLKKKVSLRPGELVGRERHVVSPFAQRFCLSWST
jgi:hypothetical protein